jgi:hypothetical protein
LIWFDWFIWFVSFNKITRQTRKPNNGLLRLVDFFSTLLESEANMTETCYSKGQKVILVTSQNKNGKWLCKFSIPGFNHLDGGQHDQASLKAHKTEWEARTDAFQRAKLFLTGSQDMTHERLLEKA